MVETSCLRERLGESGASAAEGGLRSRGVEPLRWYGVWLFVDWLDFSGAKLDPSKAGGRGSRSRTRSQPTRPLSPTQSRLSSRGTQRSELTGQTPAKCWSLSIRSFVPA